MKQWMVINIQFYLIFSLNKHKNSFIYKQISAGEIEINNAIREFEQRIVGYKIKVVKYKKIYAASQIPLQIISSAEKIRLYEKLIEEEQGAIFRCNLHRKCNYEMKNK